jgi:hypothetical protein
MPSAIYVDADACPVKDEVYKVAARHGLEVVVVSNRFVSVPRDPAIRRVIVDQGPDVADDWIAGHAARGDIVVTGGRAAGRAVRARRRGGDHLKGTRPDRILDRHGAGDPQPDGRIARRRAR